MTLKAKKMRKRDILNIIKRNKRLLGGADKNYSKGWYNAFCFIEEEIHKLNKG